VCVCAQVDMSMCVCAHKDVTMCVCVCVFVCVCAHVDVSMCVCAHKDVTMCVLHAFVSCDYYTLQCAAIVHGTTTRPAQKVMLLCV
jgi:hypothetical protein